MKKIILLLLIFVVNFSIISNEIQKSDEELPKVIDLKKLGGMWCLVTTDRETDYGYYIFANNKTNDPAYSDGFRLTINDYTKEPFYKKGNLNYINKIAQSYGDMNFYACMFGLSFLCSSVSFVIGGLLEYYMPKSRDWPSGSYIGIIGGLIGGVFGITAIVCFAFMIWGIVEFVKYKKLFLENLNANAKENKSSSIMIKFDLRFGML